MAIRTFAGIQTMGAASQPVFGTTISAVAGFAPDQWTGKVGPGNNDPIFYCTLTSGLGFLKGDRVVIGPKANFITPAAIGGLDVGLIIAINNSTGVAQIQGLQKTHPTGEYVLLADAAQTVYIIPRVTTGLLYVGTDNTVASADPSVFDVLPIYNGTGVVPFWHESKGGTGMNAYNLNQYWINGTSGDTFYARYVLAG